MEFERREKPRAKSTFSLFCQGNVSVASCKSFLLNWRVCVFFCSRLQVIILGSTTQSSNMSDIVTPRNMYGRSGMVWFSFTAILSWKVCNALLQKLAVPTLTTKEKLGVFFFPWHLFWILVDHVKLPVSQANGIRALQKSLYIDVAAGSGLLPLWCEIISPWFSLDEMYWWALGSR